eukprot:173669-Rhodomonas_salina.1
MKLVNCGSAGWSAVAPHNLSARRASPSLVVTWCAQHEGLSLSVSASRSRKQACATVGSGVPI